MTNQTDISREAVERETEGKTYLLRKRQLELEKMVTNKDKCSTNRQTDKTDGKLMRWESITILLEK